MIKKSFITVILILTIVTLSSQSLATAKDLEFTGSPTTYSSHAITFPSVPGNHVYYDNIIQAGVIPFSMGAVYWNEFPDHTAGGIQLQECITPDGPLLAYVTGTVICVQKTSYDQGLETKITPYLDVSFHYYPEGTTLVPHESPGGFTIRKMGSYYIPYEETKYRIGPYIDPSDFLPIDIDIYNTGETRTKTGNLQYDDGTYSGTFSVEIGVYGQNGTGKNYTAGYKGLPSWSTASTVTLSNCAFDKTVTNDVADLTHLIVKGGRYSGSPAFNCTNSEVFGGTTFVDNGGSYSSSYYYDPEETEIEVTYSNNGSTRITTTVFRSRGGSGSVVVPTPDPTPGGSFTWEVNHYNNYYI